MCTGDSQIVILEMKQSTCLLMEFCHCLQTYSSCWIEFDHIVHDICVLAVSVAESMSTIFVTIHVETEAGDMLLIF